MPGERFRTDLYAGVADAYERFRPPYPAKLIDHLVARVAPTGTGRLLDLACGPGPLAFALRSWFGETWAVDQEPDMVRVVTEKAGAATDVRPIVSSAETLVADPEYFELVTIGTAFHRLPRDEVARRVARWLCPGGHLALCWAGIAWEDETADWQIAMRGLLERWCTALGTVDRIPTGWNDRRRETPDPEILTAAGFEVVGRYEFPQEHVWDVAHLVGLVHSTSILPRSALGDRADEFASEVTDVLAPYLENGLLRSTMQFAYDLARLPAR